MQKENRETKNRMRASRLVACGLALASLILSASGCVPYTTYEHETSTLRAALAREKGELKALAEKQESKDADKGRTLAELTERYGLLQKEHERAQSLHYRLKSDVEGLLADLANLKLIITSNAKSMKGSAASEMLITIASIEERLNGILKAEKEAKAQDAPRTDGAK